MASLGDIYRSTCGRIELRCGGYQEVLADVAEVDAVITDPPYGARTHGGQRHGRKDERYGVQDGSQRLSSRGISYAHWTPGDVTELYDQWAPRVPTGWIAAMTSHDLWQAYELAAQKHDRYPFVPISCVQRAMNVRLAGDGPANWTIHLMTSRPRKMNRWGALPGAYVGPAFDVGENSLDRSKRPVPGGKPLWLMQAIVRDYSRAGDLVCDPCAGGGTTLLAAAIEGRRAIGAELDPVTFAKAVRRLERGYTAGFEFTLRSAEASR